MSLHEFLDMGGYGAYVWSSYAITLVVVVVNVILPKREHKAILRDIKKRAERNRKRA